MFKDEQVECFRGGPELRGNFSANSANLLDFRRFNSTSNFHFNFNFAFTLFLFFHSLLLATHTFPSCLPVHLPPLVATPNPPTRFTSVSAASGKFISLYPGRVRIFPRSLTLIYPPALTFSTPKRTAKPTLSNSPAAPVTSAKTRPPTASTRTS